MPTAVQLKPEDVNVQFQPNNEVLIGPGADRVAGVQLPDSAYQTFDLGGVRVRARQPPSDGAVDATMRGERAWGRCRRRWASKH